jgi:hypothetical protein
MNESFERNLGCKFSYSGCHTADGFALPSITLTGAHGSMRTIEWKPRKQIYSENWRSLRNTVRFSLIAIDFLPDFTGVSSHSLLGTSLA